MSKKIRILLIEDDPDILELMTDYLSGFYECKSFIDEKQALKWMEFNEVDLVISDHTMHVTGGPEVYRQVKKLYPTTKFFVCSGYAPANIAPKYGPDVEYFYKPFNLNDLKNAIDSI